MKLSTCFLLLLAFNQPFIIIAQKDIQEKPDNQLVQYFYLSVDFYSIGQGTNRIAEDELSAIISKQEKKYKVKLKHENLYWGKEGEVTVYIDVSELPVAERINLLNALHEKFQDKNKMAIVQANLYYQPVQQSLFLGVMLHRQNITRETAVLKYIEGYEKNNKVKINSGSMINETAIQEDQDKRYQFDLARLTETQKTELIKKVRELMGVTVK